MKRQPTVRRKKGEQAPVPAPVIPAETPAAVEAPKPVQPATGQAPASKIVTSHLPVYTLLPRLKL